jgi:hypothetical protein
MSECNNYEKILENLLRQAATDCIIAIMACIRFGKSPEGALIVLCQSPCLSICFDR